MEASAYDGDNNSKPASSVVKGINLNRVLRRSPSKCHYIWADQWLTKGQTDCWHYPLALGGRESWEGRGRAARWAYVSCVAKNNYWTSGQCNNCQQTYAQYIKLHEDDGVMCQQRAKSTVILKEELANLKCLITCLILLYALYNCDNG